MDLGASLPRPCDIEPRFESHQRPRGNSGRTSLCAIDKHPHGPTLQVTMINIQEVVVQSFDRVGLDLWLGGVPRHLLLIADLCQLRVADRCIQYSAYEVGAADVGTEASQSSRDPELGVASQVMRLLMPEGQAALAMHLVRVVQAALAG
jgi:hypothetical protein